MLLGNLAGYLCAVGDVSNACEAAREAVHELGRREPDAPYVVGALEHLALGLALQGTLDRAATLAAYCDASLRRHGAVRSYTETTTYRRLWTLLSERFPASALERLVAEGAALTPEAAVFEAIGKP